MSLFAYRTSSGSPFATFWHHFGSKRLPKCPLWSHLGLRVRPEWLPWDHIFSTCDPLAAPATKKSRCTHKCNAFCTFMAHFCNNFGHFWAPFCHLFGNFTCKEIVLTERISCLNWSSGQLVACRQRGRRQWATPLG